MRLRVLAVGRSRASWARDAQSIYLERLQRYGRVECVEIRAARGAAAGEPRRAVEDEGARILKALRPSERLIVLDEGGDATTSEGLARWLARWQQDGRDLAFVIGGAHGLASTVRERAERHVSLSPLTLPHLLARVVFLEQLYRAHTLLRGEPYHHS